MVLSSIYYTWKCQQCPKSVILDGSCGTVFPVYSLLMNGWEDPTFENRCLELPANQCRRCKRTRIQSLSGEDPLEEGMATHSSILAWRIPMGRGAWWATIHRVAKTRMWLKQLSTHACKVLFILFANMFHIISLLQHYFTKIMNVIVNIYVCVILDFSK